MKTKRYLLETATLITAAALCAIVANALAARERKLALPGDYPNATQVPARTESLTPMPTTTTAPVEQTVTVATATDITATVAPLTPESAPLTTSVAAAPTARIEPAPPPRPVVDLSKLKPHPEKAYIEIPGDQVAALHAAGALFLDARRTSVFEQGHIAGARSFSVWESDIDEKVNRLYEERSTPEEQNKPIVIYCSGGDCEDSHMLAQKLWGLQFNNLYVYKDGFPDWQKRGGAARTGTTP